MDLGIKGKSALVTGGAGGIGFAIVKDLLSNGANVAFTSRSRERLDVAMHKLEEQGLSALARPLHLQVAQDDFRAVKILKYFQSQ